MTLRRAMYAGVALLSLIGVIAATGRAVFVRDLATRVEPARIKILALFRNDPIAHTGDDLARFDGQYAASPVLTLFHVVPGGLFLALAPLQFSARIRTRYRALHRWSGRALLALAVTSVISSFYFGLFTPFGGVREAAAIGLFGGLFLVALARAFAAIRSRDVDRHREWIIRAFAIALAISTIRVVNLILDVGFMPTGSAVVELFVASLWIGWPATMLSAEAWIRYTR